MGKISFLKKLREVPCIACDSSIFIYGFEEHPKYAHLLETIFEKIEEYNIEILGSVILFSEILVGPLKAHDVTIAETYMSYFSPSDTKRFLPVSSRIAIKAAELRAEYNLPLVDCIHLATAIHEKAPLFLTNDKALKRVQEITVICLDDIV